MFGFHSSEAIRGDPSIKERGQDAFFLQTVTSLTEDVASIAAALESTEDVRHNGEKDSIRGRGV
jgi:hypothetical protein